LYDSSDYWSNKSKTEGFGLPPLEAMACGCKVFASVNGALSDYLDPGFNCQKIRVYDKHYDAERILSTLKGWDGPADHERLVSEYRRTKVKNRLKYVLTDINYFFDHADYAIRTKPHAPSHKYASINMLIMSIKDIFNK
jgi:glycosyltransferase involved in cell wall biosynthesis